MTICGSTQEEHDHNLEQFLKASHRDCLELNDDKCVYFTTFIDLLGHRISGGRLQPDPDRLRALLDLPTPHDHKSLQ